AGPPGDRDRRGRLLPDDEPGARDLDGRGDPLRDGDHQQRAPRDGPAVAGAVLRGALLAGLPVLRRAGLREARGSLRLRWAPRRAPGRGGRRDRQGAVDRGPERRDRFPRGLEGDVLPDGPGGREQRRHHRRARGPAADERPGRGAGRMKLHTISVLVEDKPGVLTRVAGLFAARGFNIDSLAVGPTDDAGMSRMTIVVQVDTKPLEQVTKQLNKLVNVIKILEH